MIQKVERYIRQYRIIEPCDRIIAGVSGGADSVCLFLVLTELKKRFDLDLQVVHVEHGIRGKDSADDAKFTQDLCRKYDIPCRVVNVDVPAFASKEGLGLEEAARLLRYREFEKCALESGAKIALAHHREDNAETILFQMIRGSGLHGVTGMAPVRTDVEGLSYIRPLLCLSRGEIEQYLSEKGQDFRTDATNFDTDYDRNRIRHKVIPELSQINSQAVAHINDTAAKLGLIEDYVNSQVEKAVEQVLTVSEDRYELHTGLLKELHPAIKSECVLEIIARAAGRRKDIGAVHVNQVLDMMSMQSGKKVVLPYSLEARLEYDRILITRADGSGDLQETADDKIYISRSEIDRIFNSGETLTVKLPDGAKSVDIKAFAYGGDFNKIPQNPYTKWVDYGKIKDGFYIRKRESGDYFVNDASGHRKKVKDFFINEKVPASKRDQVWLMAKEQEVFVIFGYRLSEAYKVTGDTKYILEISLKGSI